MASVNPDALQMAQQQRAQQQKTHVHRRNLSYQEKLMVIRKKDAEPSWTQENLALWAREQFKLNTKPTQATISNILRSREKLQSMNVPPDFRSARPVKNPELDLAMIRWVLSMLSNNAPLTRDAIQQRAVALAEEMKITTGITFSKGWVSSFMKRHQLHFRKKQGDSVDADLEVIRHPLVPAAIAPPASNEAAPAPAASVAVGDVTPAPAKQPNKRKRAPNNAIITSAAAPTTTTMVPAQAPAWDPSASATNVAQLHHQQQQLLLQQQQLQQQLQQQQQVSGFVVTPAVTPSIAADDLFVLQWLAVPGNYLRWKKHAGMAAKAPLVEEINGMLRGQNLRDLTGIEVRVKIATLVKSFKAASSWLSETGLHEALDIERAAGGNDVKSHVLQLCKHYDLLAPVLTDHVSSSNDEEDEDNDVEMEDHDTQAKRDQETAAKLAAANSSKSIPSPKPTPPPAANKKRRNSTNSGNNSNKQQQADKQLGIDREKQQQLFDLECQKLQVDIEAKQVQLMVEKTLARKKLLDAGIPVAEVDKIFPM
ncbi:putative Ars binding protein 1, partial [Globisporangium splendens]